jgi:hypothetical protein
VRMRCAILRSTSRGSRCFQFGSRWASRGAGARRCAENTSPLQTAAFTKTWAWLIWPPRWAPSIPNARHSGPRHSGCFVGSRAYAGRSRTTTNEEMKPPTRTDDGDEDPRRGETDDEDGRTTRTDERARRARKHQSPLVRGASLPQSAALTQGGGAAGQSRSAGCTGELGECSGDRGSPAWCRRTRP